MPSDAALKALGVGLLSGECAGIAVLAGRGGDEAQAALRACLELGMHCMLCGETAGLAPEGDPRVTNLGRDATAISRACAALARLFGLFSPQPAFALDFGGADGSGFRALGVPVIDGAGRDALARALRLGHVRLKPKPPALPVGFDPAFEGERAAGEGMTVALCELALARDMDGLGCFDTIVEGPELAGTRTAALVVEVAGRRMAPELEPVIESRLHVWLNRLQGVRHEGRRDRCRLWVSAEAVGRGLSLGAIGDMLCAMACEEFGAAAERCRVRWVTTPEGARRVLRELALPAYWARDARLKSLTDATADRFYTCATCQSIAPGHCCVITPERPGMCGTVAWPDAAASFRLNPIGPHRPAEKDAVDAAVRAASGGAIEGVSLYGLMDRPMSTCGRCECLCALEPVSGGVALCDREYPGMTPLGMRFDELADAVARGGQTPGFMGVCRAFIPSARFLVGEGGPLRIVWMPTALKDAVGPALDAAVEARHGIARFTGLIADETVCTEPDALLRWLRRRGHPALGLRSLI